MHRKSEKITKMTLDSRYIPKYSHLTMNWNCSCYLAALACLSSASAAWTSSAL